MPVYEYQCQDCGKTFEDLQAISDKPLKNCKFCNGTVQRLISRTSFSLKGGGWYKDGYASPKPESAAPASGKESKSQDKSSEQGPAKAEPSPRPS